jgi:N-acetylmuramoyl-L-alanine amidase
MIPLGFVGETLCGSAGWDPDTNTVYLGYPPASGLTPLAVQVVSAKVNLRSGPAISYSIVGSGLLGEELPILAQQNGFYQVSRAGSQAWVASWVIEVAWGYHVPLNPEVYY